MDHPLGELRLSNDNANSNLDNRTNVDMNGNGHLWYGSPDEYVIRQRGKRRQSHFSPDTDSNANNAFLKTPTKIPPSMILRSSPRKRLAMGSTPESNESNRNISHTPAQPKKARLHKMETKSMEQQNNKIPLKDDAGMDSLERQLLHAKRNIYKSLPKSRLCKKTDSAAYSRAVLHLNEFKRQLSQHLEELQESCHYDALLDYILVAWPCVRTTPIWDNASHNLLRRQCFKLLSSHTIKAIAAMKAAGLRSNRLAELEKNLHCWAEDYEDVVLCVSTLSKTLTKGRTSL